MFEKCPDNLRCEKNETYDTLSFCHAIKQLCLEKITFIRNI